MIKTSPSNLEFVAIPCLSNIQKLLFSTFPHKLDGRPKYFSFIVSFVICNSCITSSLCWLLVFLLNSTVDLSLLIICPEQSSYKWSIPCKCKAFSLFARMKIRESSANKRWEMLGALGQILTPLILPSVSALCNRDEKPSAHNKDKYGDNGSPCLNPLCGRNCLPRITTTICVRALLSIYYLYIFED